MQVQDMLALSLLAASPECISSSLHDFLVVICLGMAPPSVMHPAHRSGHPENLQDMRKRMEAARRVMIVGNGGIALELVYASAYLLQLKSAAVPTGLVCLVCFGFMHDV